MTGMLGGRLAPPRKTEGFRAGAALAVAAVLTVLTSPLLLARLPAPETPLDLWLVAMIGLAGLSEIWLDRRDGPRFAHLLVPSDAVLVIGLAFAGPAALIGGRLVALLGAETVRRRSPAKLALNAAVCAAETVVALAVYRAVLAGAGVASARGIAAAGLAVAASTGVGLAAMGTMLGLHGLPVERRIAVRSVVLAVVGLAVGVAALLAVTAVAA